MDTGGTSGREQIDYSDSEIRRTLSLHLPADFYDNSPSRLVYPLIASALLGIHFHVTAGWQAGRFSLLAYASSLIAAGITFPFFLFALHEIAHGAIVRKLWLRYMLGTVVAIPIMFQYSFWKQIHGHHHVHANTESDTDRLRIYGKDEPGAWLLDFRLTNLWSIPAAIFAIHWVYFYCLVGFLTGRLHYELSRVRVIGMLLCNLVLLVCIVTFLGLKAAIGAFGPVLLLGSALQNAYIITNHLTRPLTKDPDALRTGVSVNVFGVSHMGFGRHVEHHLFPGVSHRKLRTVTENLRRFYPDRFREMPLWSAVCLVFRLPGYFYTDTVLTDRDGRLRITID